MTRSKIVRFKPLPLLSSTLFAVLALQSAVAFAAPAAGSEQFVSGDQMEDRGLRMLGRHRPFLLQDLPASRLRSKLERLPNRARERGIEWLHRFDFPVEDVGFMEADDEGAVLYVDPPVSGGAERAEGPSADSYVDTGGSPAVDDPFSLHSRPGSANVVYLDFDGHTITGTAWNSSQNTYEAKPFDLDGDPASFNATERAAIAEIWHRVAEDYAPFDIDVTTEEPAKFNSTTGRVLITSKKDANGVSMPSGSAGGVAYIGVWGRYNYHTYYSPALVYFDNLAKGTTYIAESAAHELGHNFGLSHDGTSSTSYYKGHGSGDISWAPIMGTAFYKNVTQWSKGEYTDANNNQDDIAIIAGSLGAAVDDHGDTPGSATPLKVESNGDVLMSTPEIDPSNAYPQNKGIIEAAADVDVFSFTAGSGTLDLTVTPAWEAFYRTNKRGANLDLEVRLLDSSGAVLETVNPAADTEATLSVSVKGGTYYLEVSGAGSANYSDYGSLGQYFISGTIPTQANGPPTAAYGFSCMELDCSFTDQSTDSDGSISSWSWDFGDGSSSSSRNPAHTYATSGSYTVRLVVTDDQGATGSVSQTVTVAQTPTDPPSSGGAINFNDYTLSGYGGSQDRKGVVQIEDGGATLYLQGNRWQKIAFPYTVTANTVLEFDYSSDSEGEIQGIGVDVDNSLKPSQSFKVYGTQDVWNQDFDDYSGSGVKHYVIPLGQYYTGKVEYLLFVNDHDVSNPTSESRFSNVRVYEQ